MRFTYRQAYCRYCRSPRLFACAVHTATGMILIGSALGCLLLSLVTPLVAYSLAIVWFVGFIGCAVSWAVYTLIQLIQPEIYRCTVCGHAEYEQTPEEQAHAFRYLYNASHTIPTPPPVIRPNNQPRVARMRSQPLR